MTKLSALAGRTGSVWSSAALTLGFYGLLAALAWGLEKISPSGPCTPGAVILVLFGSPVISSILLVVNGWRVVSGRQHQWLSALVHGLALGGWWLLVHPQ